ncbi:ArsR/SmtB family transcription factor [Pokkaliibacter sp. CJK22405]|uniref:ArsR/SmtB family transcription factor n=1 Tax=Pokkaliibacter sp. CJK22405 TaxID=3384615 RepID=UPI0039851ECD
MSPTENASSALLQHPPEDLHQVSEAGARLLKAIANKSRLLILFKLLGRELSVTELNTEIDISQSSLSQHLAVLRHEGLVATRRDGQTIFYSLSGIAPAQLLATLAEVLPS